MSLSPRAVLDPAYEALRAELSPHLIVVPARSRDRVLDTVARADVILGDWTHELGACIARHGLGVAAGETSYAAGHPSGPRS